MTEHVFFVPFVIIILLFVVSVFLQIQLSSKSKKVLELKKFFLFSIDVFTGVVIAMASGDNDAVEEWTIDQINKLMRAKIYSPKKTEAWYFLAREVLYNKASDRFDTAMKLIEQKHYSQALDVLVISNKEIMEYEVRK